MPEAQSRCTCLSTAYKHIPKGCTYVRTYVEPCLPNLFRYGHDACEEINPEMSAGVRTALAARRGQLS